MDTTATHNEYLRRESEIAAVEITEARDAIRGIAKELRTLGDELPEHTEAELMVAASALVKTAMAIRTQAAMLMAASNVIAQSTHRRMRKGQ